MASLSLYAMAHPPRSNPPLRSSSDPPSPCITPSTVTIVVVVSFMVASLFSLGRSSFADRNPRRQIELDPQLAALFTSARIFFSSAAVNSFSA